MPCKSTTKLANLPDELQSFEIATEPFMNRRWKVLSTEVEDLWVLLKKFRSLIGCDPFEHLIVKIDRMYRRYTPLLDVKKSTKTFFAKQNPSTSHHSMEQLLTENKAAPKAITSKLSMKLKWAQLEDPNLLILFEHLVDLKLFKRSIGITPQQVRQLMQESVVELGKIKKLNLSRHKLTCLPKELLLFQSLRSLNLSHNHLEFLPEWIGELEALESINISKNRLYNLPSSFYKLKHLKTLFIHSNRLAHVPLRLSHLPNLKRLIS